MIAKNIVGVTGGIGSGKTSASKFFGHNGAFVIDADRISHQVTAPGGEAIPSIVQIFGDDFVNQDGGLNREKMRDHVFHNQRNREKLQALLHPIIAHCIHSEIMNCNESVVVLDIPLLAESVYWRRYCDLVVVVDCSVQRQISRVQMRNNWDPRQVSAVIKTQATRSDRLAVADIVISNDNDEWKLLENNCKAIISRLRTQ